MKHIELDVIYNEDCLEGMAKLPDSSIDLILCDLPYGTTACKWDVIIPFEPLWEQYNRIIRDNGAIVLFGSEPFSTELRHSNLKMYKYDWVWNKKKAGNIFLAKYQPMKIHENIMVFGKGTVSYYPIMVKREKLKKSKNYGTGEVMGGNRQKEETVYTYTHKNPVTILEFSNAVQKGKVHPTQKPVPLLEYLILTYTLEGDVVLDNCCGSGSTLVAAVNTNRHYIGFELDANYFDVACQRLDEAEARRGEYVDAIQGVCSDQK